MARYNIIDAESGAVKYSGTPKYNGTYCKVSYLEFPEIASPTKIDWKVGDYVVYNGSGRTGLTYRLFDIPQPKKQSRNGEYGGAYIYSNVQFYPDTKWLDIEPFRDVVLADNDIHFSTRESWSVWASVADLVERLQAVMDEARPNEWLFRLVNATSGSDLYNLLHNNYQDFTISGESVLGGLDKIYNQWGDIGWLHTYENVPNAGWRNVITLGIPPMRTSGIGTDASGNYIYGKGNGLLSLKKTLSNKDELRTRLFVYGSTRNMVPRYYNNLVPAIKDNESVDIQHLMIPLEYWGTTGGKKDASKAFIENNTDLYGVRADTAYFDGSDLEEIYPSLAGCTIGNLYDAMASGAAYRPNLSKWDRDDRIDEVVSCWGISDNGQLSTNGSKYTATEDRETDYIYELFTAEDHSKDYYLVGLYVSQHSGQVTFNLADCAPTLVDDAGHIATLSGEVRITAGGKKVSTAVDWTKDGDTYTFNLGEYKAAVNSGDDVYVEFVLNFTVTNPSIDDTIDFTVQSVTSKASYSALLKKTFNLRIPQIGFNMADRSALGSQGIATIAINDGKCGGRSFVVKSSTYNATLDAWDLELYRGQDESLDAYFPNTDYPIEAGDHYVLLDIAMPDTYIGMAEQRLYAAGQELLADISRIRPFYEPEIDAKFMTDNSRTLREGWYMAIQDADIIGSGITEYVLIDSLVISEGESEIPTYKITLREQKRKTYSNTGTGSGYSLTSLAGGSQSQAVSGGGGLSSEQKEILANLNSWFGQDSDGNIYVKKNASNVARNFYSYGEISAGGAGTGGGGGGLIENVYGYTDLGGTYSDSVKTNTFNAYTIARLASRITSLEERPAGGVTSFNTRTGAVVLTAADVNAVISYQAPITASSKLSASLVSGLATVATSGAYGDLSGKPTALKNPYALSWSGYSSGSYDGSEAKSLTIPSNTNQLTNGAGFITASALSGYATQTWVENKGYALASALSGYLPLSGGTMTGNIIIGDHSIGASVATSASWNDLARGRGLQIFNTVNAPSAGAPNNYSVGLYIQGYYGFQIACKSGENDFVMRSTANAVAANVKDWVTLYHSGNVNNTSTPWSASSMTLNGAISGVTSIDASNEITSGNHYIDAGTIFDLNRNGGTGTMYDSTKPALEIEAYTDNTIRFKTYSPSADGAVVTLKSGKVGIGTTSPTEKLTVAGNITATGEISAGSDRRWKHDIKPVADGLSAILRLQPSEWTWNSDNHKGSGLIAQDVQSVLPHLVKTDGNGYLHLAYDGFHAYEISAIQQLHKRIAELEKEIQTLKNS